MGEYTIKKSGYYVLTGYTGFYNQSPMRIKISNVGTNIYATAGTYDDTEHQNVGLTVVANGYIEKDDVISVYRANRSQVSQETFYLGILYIPV